MPTSSPDRETGSKSGHETSASAGRDGYETKVVIETPSLRVFQAIASVEGLVGWWASSATGSCSPDGKFQLAFAGLDETITWRVDTLVAPSSVVWTCLSHTGLPDWNDTKVVFELNRKDGFSTVLMFGTSARPGTRLL